MVVLSKLSRLIRCGHPLLFSSPRNILSRAINTSLAKKTTALSFRRARSPVRPRAALATWTWLAKMANSIPTRPTIWRHEVRRSTIWRYPQNTGDLTKTFDPHGSPRATRGSGRSSTPSRSLSSSRLYDLCEAEEQPYRMQNMRASLFFTSLSVPVTERPATRQCAGPSVHLLAPKYVNITICFYRL